MLRAIIQRKLRDRASGAEFVTHETIDFDAPELERALRGGLDIDAYNIPQVIGIEPLSKDSP